MFSSLSAIQDGILSQLEQLSSAYLWNTAQKAVLEDEDSRLVLQAAHHQDTEDVSLSEATSDGFQQAPGSLQPSKTAR